MKFIIAFHTLNVVCHSKSSFNTNLETLQQRDFLQLKFYISPTNINELSADMHFKLFTINKMKNKCNRLYLKMILFLSGNNELDPGSVNRHQIKKKRTLKFLITKDSISCILISTVFLLR